VSANRGQLLSSPIALAISPTDTDHLLLGTGSGLFRSRNGGRDWNLEAPSVVLGPVFAAAFARNGKSDDVGASWSSAADGLPDDTATTPFVVQGSPETLYAVVQGQIWASADGARRWSRRGVESLPANVDALTLDFRLAARQWAAAGDLLFRSDDGGAS
jgi:photosystem II stability/assembly factor-like uncharacterized protein